MKRAILILAAIAAIAMLEGCAMGTYTINATETVHRIAFGQTRLAGIAFVNNTNIVAGVQLGPINFKVQPGSRATVAYNSIFVGQGRNLNIECIVTQADGQGGIRGARTSWDYSNWWNPYGYTDWNNVSERVVLIELNPERTEIQLR